ncbi:MAG: response regulator [Alphaproteobacteria bacterium]|nr:response regulator [Alphaproteobacteria bacterium]
MSTKTLLIVDDSKIARMMIAKLVAEIAPGLKVVEASNGAEALAKLGSEKVDLVTVDYNMPGDDGLTVAASLKQKNAALPIALITANIQDAVKDRASKLGVAFVAKPVTDSTLRPFLKSAGATA